MTLEISDKERSQLSEVAIGSNCKEVMALLEPIGRGSAEFEDEEDIDHIRALCASALETGVAERHGFDALEDVYDKCSRELFPENFE